jgi:hypothetical protein
MIDNGFGDKNNVVDVKVKVDIEAEKPTVTV